MPINTYTLNMCPIAMARPRLSVGHVYYPQKKEKFLYGLMIKKQHGNIPFTGAISLELYFYMPIPKSYSKNKRNLIGHSVIKHTKKPDIDNLSAFVLNCMTGIVYKDDAQIFSLKALKSFDDNPRIEIRIECLE